MQIDAPELTHLAEQVSAWRLQRRNTREKMPKALWQEAVKLADKHSVTAVACSAKLNSTRLSRKVKEACTSKVKKAKALSKPQQFIAVDMPVHSEQSVEVELENTMGQKLRLRGSVDVARILSEFLR